MQCGLDSQARALQARLLAEKGRREGLEKLLEEAHEREVSWLLDGENLQQALQILQSLEESWARSFEGTVAAIVSQGLTAVFGYPMHLNVETKRVRDISNMELSLSIGEGKKEVTRQIIGGIGGGAVNVLALLLRVLPVLNARPPLRWLLILDEPFPWADEYALPESVGQLLGDLRDRKMQFLINTHCQDMAGSADYVYEAKQENGATVFKCLRAQNTERR